MQCLLCLIPIQATSHLLSHTLPTSTVLSAALLHRPLSLLLLDQEISGAQFSLENLSSYCIPSRVSHHEDLGLTDRKDCNPWVVNPLVHEVVFWAWIKGLWLHYICFSLIRVALSLHHPQKKRWKTRKRTTLLWTWTRVCIRQTGWGFKPIKRDFGD